MQKRGGLDKTILKLIRGYNHPRLKENLTLGQKAADMIATFGGSWTFITFFFLFIIVWMVINTWILYNNSFDPFPFILLNLVLSCLASFQAPIILMAQNRQTERDRLDAKYDHAVNRKAEREIQQITKELDRIRRAMREIKK